MNISHNKANKGISKSKVIEMVEKEVAKIQANGLDLSDYAKKTEVDSQISEIIENFSSEEETAIINANSYFNLNNSQQYSMVNTQQNSNQITFLDLKDFKVGDGVALKGLGVKTDETFASKGLEVQADNGVVSEKLEVKADNGVVSEKLGVKVGGGVKVDGGIEVEEGLDLKGAEVQADDGLKTWLVAKIIDIDGNVATLNREVSVSMENVEIHHDNTYNLLDISEYYSEKDCVNFYCEGGIYNLFSQAIYNKENLIPSKYGNGSSLLNFINKKYVCINFNFAEFSNKANVMYGSNKETRLYSGLTLKNCNNVNIKNLIINHNLKETLVAKKISGEYWTYGITVHGGKNVTLENITCKGIESDGFYLGHHRSDELETFAGELSGVRMINCEATECGRQGLSVGGGNNIHLIGCSFNYIGWDKDTFKVLSYRSNPSACIKFGLETGQSGDFDSSMYNIRVTKCKLINSYCIMSGVSPSGKLTIFEDCEFSQVVPDDYTASSVYSFVSIPRYSEIVLFTNCIFEQYLERGSAEWCIQAIPEVKSKIIFDTCVIKGVGYIASNNKAYITIKNSNIIGDQKEGYWWKPFDGGGRCTVENSVITLTSRWLNSIADTNLSYKFNTIKNSEYIIEDCDKDASFSLPVGDIIEEVRLINRNHNRVDLDSSISTYPYLGDIYMNKNIFKLYESYTESTVGNRISSYDAYSVLRIKPKIDEIDEVSEIKPVHITQITINNSTIECNFNLYKIDGIVKKVAKDGYLAPTNDYIDYEGGRVVNNIGVSDVLSKGIYDLKRDDTNNAVFINLRSIDDMYLPNVNSVNYCCNIFNSARSWIDGYYAPKDEEYITCVGTTGYLSFHIYYSTLECDSTSTDAEIKSAFTNWATENNVVVYYNLNTPKITHFDPIKLSITTANTISVVCENGNAEINMTKGNTLEAKLQVLARKIK